MTPDMNSLIQQAQKLKEVKRLVQSNRMIDAIKLYREITGAGLKEAKDAVEAIARGEAVQINNVVTTHIGGTPNNVADQAEKMKEVVRLIKDGNKIEAIKAFREATGVGLKEAKDAVEAIEHNRSATINTVTTSTMPYTTTPATPQAAEMQEVIRLVQSGDKIEAIKKFRELYGVGLKEAKDVIDGMDQTMSHNSGTPLPSSYKPGTPTMPPTMETVSPLNGVILSFLLLVLLVGGAAALAWFVSPELRGVILSLLK